MCRHPCDKSNSGRRFGMKPSIKEPTSHESSKVILNFQKSICSAKDSFGTKKSVMTNPKETESLSKDLKIKTSSLK